MVLYPLEHGIRLLNTPKEKSRLLEEAGVDHMIIHPFDHRFSELDSDEFIREVLVRRIGTKKLVIGYDHKFGKNRTGSFEDLVRLAPQLGFEVEKIPEQDVNHIAVSSTRIRDALMRGDIDTANAFLGGTYSLTGVVVEGNKMGRDLGFPTANIRIAEDFKLIPAEGIYIVNVIHPYGISDGMLSIGRRPTFEKEGSLSIEVYLMDFKNDLYGKEITIQLRHRIREDRKFESAQELVAQMHNDLEYTLKFLNQR
jgi:riboflavin kinase/FMN adenylyltransferase